MVNGWKVIAIIFILLFLVETTAFIFVFYIGNQYVKQKETCNYNICLNYDAFYFDSSTNICYCYKNNEIAKQEYVK